MVKADSSNCSLKDKANQEDAVCHELLVDDGVNEDGFGCEDKQLREGNAKAVGEVER